MSDTGEERTLGQTPRRKLAAAILDQALVSGPNFALNLLLGRALKPVDYGLFASGFAVLIVMLGIHSALLIEPMNVKGATRPRESRGRYLGSLTIAHGLVVAPASVGCLAVAALSHWRGSPLDGVFAALAVTFPLLSLFWLLRTACYVDDRPSATLAGSATHAAVVLVLFAILYAARALSPGVALLIFAAAAAMASIVMWRRLGIDVLDRTRADSSDAVRSVVREHWQFGRWILGGAVGASVASNLYVPVVAGMLGLAQGGAFRALQLLGLPFLQITQAAGMPVLPWFARKAVDDRRLAARTGRDLLLAGGAAAAVYGALMVAIGPALVEILYESPYYDQQTWLLRYFAGALVAISVAQVSGILLRAFGHPDGILWAKLISAAVLLIVVIPMVGTLGLRGAAIGVILVPAAEVVVAMLILARREIPRARGLKS